MFFSTVDEITPMIWRILVDATNVSASGVPRNSQAAFAFIFARVSARTSNFPEPLSAVRIYVDMGNMRENLPSDARPVAQS
jgi:hypothetical protein